MRNEPAFSLTEIMVSILILMTGILMMAHSTALVIEANYRTNQESLAAAYAQDKIEFLKTVVFTHADLASGTHSDTPAPGFSRSWTVTLGPTGTQKTVNLAVTKSMLHSTLPAKLTILLVRSK